LDITTIHRSGFVSAPIRITLNDLECPTQLKVRFTDGTLGVRLLRVSDSTVRIGVARGGVGVDWRASPPRCGQLTHCFSAVAELLVKLADTSMNTLSFDN